jgi:hypothetical protein
MKVWLTKDALTVGIKEIEAEMVRKTMISVAGSYGGYRCYCKGEWHTSREMAVRRAEELRTKKIVSLRIAIKRLEALQF